MYQLSAKCNFVWFRLAVVALLVLVNLVVTPIAQAQEEPPIDPPDFNPPPTAAFTFSCNGLTCTFDGRASNDDSAIISYQWNFGNGQTGSGPVVSHTYAAAGTYSVRLTVRDDEGAVGSTTQSVTIPPPATGPLIRVMFGNTPVGCNNNTVVQFGVTRVNVKLFKDFFVFNDGTGTLIVSNLHASNNTGFKVVSGTFTVPPSPGKFTVRLYDTVPGAKLAVITITSNAVNHPVCKFFVEGAVVP